MALLRTHAGDWRLGAKALFRLEATLLGVACFSAGGVPRLLPVLLGILGLVAAIHVFTTDRARLFKYMRTALGIALLVFIAYLSINATWSPDPAEGLAKAGSILGLVAAVCVIGASYSLRSDREARVLAKSALAALRRNRFSPDRGEFR